MINFFFIDIKSILILFTACLRQNNLANGNHDVTHVRVLKNRTVYCTKAEV